VRSVETRLKVLLVEDDPGFRQAFASSIEREPGFALQCVCGTLAEGREAIARGLPDVLLVDLGLPDGSGLDLIREVYMRDARVNIMVVTVFGDEQHVFRALEAGATGYLLKDAAPEEVAVSIRQLADGGSPISPAIARKLLSRVIRKPEPPRPVKAARAAQTDKPHHGPFSEREYEILTIIARGFSSEEIARMLSISPHTVISHVKNIYQKLAVHSRAEAVFEARQMGILQ
jgi:DNA-binding NarL/FixJ family response regulator